MFHPLPPTPPSFYWFPIEFRIEFKTLLITYNRVFPSFFMVLSTVILWGGGRSTLGPPQENIKLLNWKLCIFKSFWTKNALITVSSAIDIFIMLAVMHTHIHMWTHSHDFRFSNYKSIPVKYRADNTHTHKPHNYKQGWHISHFHFHFSARSADAVMEREKSWKPDLLSHLNKPSQSLLQLSVRQKVTYFVGRSPPQIDRCKVSLHHF